MYDNFRAFLWCVKQKNNVCDDVLKHIYKYTKPSEFTMWKLYPPFDTKKIIRFVGNKTGIEGGSMRYTSFVFYLIKNNKIEDIKLLLENGFSKTQKYKLYIPDSMSGCDGGDSRTLFLTMFEYATRYPYISPEMKKLVKP